ncbi:transposase [Vibrio cidicii]|uniref:transposase n=1 Tax=Vibrio cidicii TaxID=1763883 RepID=UPI002E7ACE61|nr:transposase [Vibrio cidicii]
METKSVLLLFIPLLRSSWERKWKPCFYSYFNFKISLTPKQHSSGGKERIGHISKKSADMRLRSTLFQGALSVVSLVVNRPARTNKEQWLKALVERRGKKVAAIALANKTVRTAYALLKNDSVYQLEKLA